MNKELSDRAWQVLPKEFKEEVKKMHRKYIECINEYDSNHRNGRANVMAKIICMNTIFGHHNLTSDAEGEDDEMLCVSRKDMQFYYQYYKAKRESELSAEQKAYYKGRTKVLLDLFGSKCLPDESTDCTPVEVGVAENATTSNVDSPEDNVGSLEPKFKLSDTAYYVCSPTVKHKCTVTKVMQNGHSGKWEYNVMFEWGKPGMWIPESDLQPCTEPTETCTDDCPSPRPSQHFDKIINRGFADHNRLHIAAMLAAGMLANDVRRYPIDRALELADVLIEASHKSHK